MYGYMLMAENQEVFKPRPERFELPIVPFCTARKSWFNPKLLFCEEVLVPVEPLNHHCGVHQMHRVGISELIKGLNDNLPDLFVDMVENWKQENGPARA